MKLHILSDLHLEFEDFSLCEKDYDILILAGDIHVGEKAVNWIKANVKDKPVLYVPGNHEYYNHAYPKLLDKLEKSVQDSSIHILENKHIKIGDLNFLGCTLWTDFEILEDPKIAGYQCEQILNDFRKIRVSPEYSKFKARNAAFIHYRSRKWLEKTLQNLKNEKTVIISHHAPSIQSTEERYRKEILTSAYLSDLEGLIREYKVNLWIHGHIHKRSDYNIEDCKVICNPRGYPDERVIGFDPELMYDCI